MHPVQWVQAGSQGRVAHRRPVPVTKPRGPAVVGVMNILGAGVLGHLAQIGASPDFDESTEPFPVGHYAFRVDDQHFDAIVHRLTVAKIPYRSTPHGAVDMQINTYGGGRLLYWNGYRGQVHRSPTRQLVKPGTTVVRCARGAIP
jgi:hypothetical protein